MKKNELGTATKLRADLTPDNPPANWPQSVQAMTGHLNRIEPSLREVGITIEKQRNSTERILTISSRNVEPVTPVMPVTDELPDEIVEDNDSNDADDNFAEAATVADDWDDTIDIPF